MSKAKGMRKRYIFFKTEREYADLDKHIREILIRFFGVALFGRLGYKLVEQNKKYGIIRVQHMLERETIACLSLEKERIYVLGVSGSIKAGKEKFFKGWSVKKRL